MIITRNLTKLFDRYEAVSNLSLEIQPGCIYGLVGTNGAGKSTLLRTLAGIYRPSSGEALLDDHPIFDHVPAKSRIVLVPDDLWFFAEPPSRRWQPFTGPVTPAGMRKNTAVC